MTFALDVILETMLHPHLIQSKIPLTNSFCDQGFVNFDYLSLHKTSTFVTNYLTRRQNSSLFRLFQLKVHRRQFSNRFLLLCHCFRLMYFTFKVNFWLEINFFFRRNQYKNQNSIPNSIFSFVVLGHFEFWRASPLAARLSWEISEKDGRLFPGCLGRKNFSSRLVQNWDSLAGQESYVKRGNFKLESTSMSSSRVTFMALVNLDFSYFQAI